MDHPALGATCVDRRRSHRLRAADLIDAYGVAPERVSVVPHGVEASLGTAAHRVRTPAGLRLGPGPIIVFPAITDPHKGHRFLLDVMAQHWTDPDLRLVLLGGAGSADDEVNADIERLGLQRRIVRTGRVSDAHRDGLIARHGLVFPSQYEGFGAPVVEAMALGTPVICSDQPALVEVVGDAGTRACLDAGGLVRCPRRRGTRRGTMRRPRSRRAATSAPSDRAAPPMPTGRD